jgi:hypothetical protein
VAFVKSHMEKPLFVVKSAEEPAAVELSIAADSR